MAIKHNKPETLVGPEMETIEVAPAPPERPEPPEIVAAEPYAAMPAPAVPMVAAPAEDIAFADVCELSAASGLAAPPGAAETLAVAADDTVGFVEEVIGLDPWRGERTEGFRPPLDATFEAATEAALAEFDAGLELAAGRGSAAARAKMMAAFPSAACLYPYEIEEFARSGRLSEPRQRHIQRCAACAAVLEVQRRLHQEDEASEAQWELLAALAAQRSSR